MRDREGEVPDLLCECFNKQVVHVLFSRTGAPSSHSALIAAAEGLSDIVMKCTLSSA